MTDSHDQEEGTIQHGFPLMRRFYGWMGMKSAHQRRREQAESE